jgi:branched-chain amino acid transport system substrate-binding protein
VKKLALAVSLALAAGVAHAQTIKIAGFGAKSGPVRSFGVNSEAALLAAADVINKSGGVKLADGRKAKIEIEFYDDRCDAVGRYLSDPPHRRHRCRGGGRPDLLQRGRAALRHPAEEGRRFERFRAFSSPCSPTWRSKSASPRSPNGRSATCPTRSTMYNSLFYWLRTKHPELKTVYGGVEEDFAHSRATWYVVMKPRAEASGFQVLGNSKWLLADTNFATQVREMKRANADIIAISAHPFLRLRRAEGDAAPAREA